VPRRTRWIPWLLFGVLLLSYAYFFQGGGYNPNSRLALTRALAERHSIAIDAYPHTGDWAEYSGHRYTNKAPGLSFVSAPFYALARALGGAREGPQLSGLVWAANLVVNALPSALLGLLLFHTLGRLGLASGAVRAWAILALGLGTLAFPYATAFYAHQPAAAASFGAFALLLGADPGAPPRWRGLLAGAAAGLAVLLEVSTGLCAVILGLFLALDAGRRPLLPWFVLGGLPMAGALGLYNAVAFGSPLSFWFDHANPEVEVRVDGRLFGPPTLIGVMGLLFLPYRGLFFTSPLLMLAPLGWSDLKRADLGAARVCAAVPLAFLALIASFHGWYGGWTPGARYLLPSLPFLFVPLAFGVARWPRLAAALALYSVASMLAISAVGVEIPHDVANPLFDFVLPRLLDGQVSVNPQALDQLMAPPGYAEGRALVNGSSFNLGELLFGSRALSLLPLLAVWALAAAGLLRASRAPR
jgi:hypothetical protein